MLIVTRLKADRMRNTYRGKSPSFSRFFLVTILLAQLLVFLDPLTPKAQAAAGTITNGSCSSVVGETTTVSIVQSGTDCILTFTSGTNSWTPPTNVTAARVLIVGGGAGGDRGQCAVYWGHGGGGGEVKDLNLPVTPGTSNSITIGSGGSGSGTCNSGNGGNGSNSVFSSITSGGGKAAAYNSAVGGHSGSFLYSGATGTGTYGAGGGAGAGGSGSTINGGPGINSDISGTTYMYGSGGAGKNDSVFGTAYSGGGVNTTYPIANRGGGGSDLAPYNNATAGAAGVVIVRYRNPASCAPTESTSGSATILRFTNVGTCTWSVPTGVNSVRVLLVGGGGGGGAWVGAGGGGGGVLEVSNVAVTSGSSQSISVGTGGYGALGTNQAVFTNGTNGASSTALGYTAYGGGTGATWVSFNTGALATSGGAAHSNNAYPGIAVARSASISPWQGFAGGTSPGDWTYGYPTAGGGGAGGPGGNAVNQLSGAGGAGRYSKITGSDAYFGGGGGGGCHGNGTYACTTGSGTNGGGSGAGYTGTQYTTIFGGAGTANTGGGGGGAGAPSSNTYFANSQGGAGGSGIVVIRYESSAPSAPAAVSATAGNGQITVNWSAPTTLNNQSVTGYQVEYSTTGSGTWTTASSSVASSATSYVVTGLSASTAYFVRVAAKYSGGLGAYGYPWTKIYSTSTPYRTSNLITYDSGFGLSGGAAATNASTSFSRIRYRMQASYNGVIKYVDADFARTLATTSSASSTFDSISKLQVPSNSGVTASQFVIQGNVSDLTILSNASEVQTGNGLSGRLEIWPWDYGATSASDLTERSSGTFDDSDASSLSGNYGSFQLHNLSSATKETAFAWNAHYTTSYDLGFGNALSGNSDWTFCARDSICRDRSDFNLAAYINAPVTTEASTTITNVTSSTTNATLGVGSSVSIQVTFSRAVTVVTTGGTPTLTLETGTTDRTATYTSGSGTTSLTFSYTVQSGDTSTDLDYAATNALVLNGGTIKDASSIDAVLTLPTPAGTGSLAANKALVIDGVAPVITSVTSTRVDGAWKAGTSIEIWINFSEQVTLTGVNNMALELETGETNRNATYLRGSPDVAFVFGYTVQAGDNVTDLDYVSTSALSLGTAFVKDAAGNNLNVQLPAPGTSGSLGANKNLVIDTAAPTVTGVTSSTADGSYVTGSTVSIQVSFSEAVTVTGTPRITLETGTTDQLVNYVSGTGTSTLTFTYTIQSSDQSTDLDYTGTSALILNSGSINDAAGIGGNAAVLTLPAPGAAGSLGANKAITINGPIAPTFSAATSRTNGFTFSITSSSATTTYSATTSAGTVAVGNRNTSSSSTPVIVSGLNAGTSATVTVTAAKGNFASVSSTITASASSPGTNTTCSPTTSSSGSSVILSFKTTTGDTNCTWTVPEGLTSASRVVIVGGGGGGGYFGNASSGGAGAVLTKSDYALTPGSTINLTIGGGGAASSGIGSGPGISGNNSVFAGVTAAGGGGGAGGDSTKTLFFANGLAGGSGGGATIEGSTGVAGASIASTICSCTSDGWTAYGNAGASGVSAAGGGGAGSAGSSTTGGSGISLLGLTLGVGGSGSSSAGTADSGSGGGTNAAGRNGIILISYPASLPGAPTIGTPTIASATSISVPFTAPASNGGMTITGYTVTASPGGNTATGASSPLTVTGLTAGTAYTFTVTATTAAGTSSPSSTSASITPNVVPAAPTIGTPTIASATSILVAFTAPTSNGGTAITGYTATSSPGGFTGTGASSPITVSGLTAGTAYTFTVIATNAHGNSLASSASASITPNVVPEAPTIGTPAIASATSITVPFTAPTANGGSAITGYTVTASPGGRTATGSSSPLTVTGLTAGTAYTFTVVATNARGNSLSSTASSSIIPNAVPANTVVPAITGTTTFNQVLSLSNGTWSNSPLTYTYSWSSSSTSGGTYTAISGAISSTYTLTTADIGMYIKGTVTGTNSAGNSSATSAATAVITGIQIATPTAPTVSTISGVLKSFSVTLSAAITGAASYTIKVYDSANTLVFTKSINTTTYTFTSADYAFLDATAYKASVTAIASAGYISSAESAKSTVAATTNTGLALPSTFTAIPTGTTPNGTRKSISVTWSSVTSASSYRVKIYDALTDGNLLTTTSLTALSGTSKIITVTEFSAIADKTTYFISITTNGNGTTFVSSSESTRISVTTHAMPSALTLETLTSSIGKTAGQSFSISVTASATDQGTLTYQWKKNGSNVASGGTSSTYSIATVATGDSGTYTVVVTNTLTGNTTTATSTNAVLTVSAALTLSGPASLVSATALLPITTITPTRAGGAATYTYSLVSKATEIAAAGLAFSTSTGAISGTPTTAASISNIQIRVTDGNGMTATTNAFTITVVASSQLPLTITTMVGTATQSLVLRTAGGSGDGSISFTYRSGANTTCSLSGITMTATTTTSGALGICYVTATKAAFGAYNAVSSAETTIYFTPYVPVITQSATCPAGTAPSAPTGIGVTGCQPIAPTSAASGSTSAAPKITSLSATTGIAGTTSIVITGSGFATVTKVQFGSKSTTTFTLAGDNTTITVIVPIGATRGRVMVASPSGSAVSLDIFTPTSSDTRAPAYLSGNVNTSTPTQINLNFDESLAASGLDKSAFGVSVASATATIASISISGTSVTLTLSAAVSSGQAVLFTYTSPGDATSLQDAAGNRSATITATSVTNTL